MDVEKILQDRKIRQLSLGPMVTVEAKNSLKNTIAAMREKQVGCVLVTENRRLVGIFTERDVLVKIMGETQDDSAKFANG
ncbi:MAG: CBS domain-containing protein [Terriglobia bacterium]